jgi:hypothetical protein
MGETADNLQNIPKISGVYPRSPKTGAIAIGAKNGSIRSPGVNKYCQNWLHIQMLNNYKLKFKTDGARALSAKSWYRRLRDWGYFLKVLSDYIIKEKTVVRA